MDPSCCPVCGVTVRPQELEQHFVHELDKLFKLTSVTPRPRQSRSALPPGAPDHPHSSLLHAPSASDGTPLGRWETFKRVKANRQVSIFYINYKYRSIILFFTNSLFLYFIQPHFYSLYSSSNSYQLRVSWLNRYNILYGLFKIPLKNSVKRVT